MTRLKGREPKKPREAESGDGEDAELEPRDSGGHDGERTAFRVDTLGGNWGSWDLKDCLIVRLRVHDSSSFLHCDRRFDDGPCL